MLKGGISPRIKLSRKFQKILFKFKKAELAIKKYLCILIVSALIVSISMIGCKEEVSPTTEEAATTEEVTTAEPVIIRVMTFFAHDNLEVEEAVVAAFEEANPNITVQLGLSYLRNEHYINWPLLMAASVLTNLPIIIFFLIAQKQFVESIKLTGLKG